MKFERILSSDIKDIDHQKRLIMGIPYPENRLTVQRHDWLSMMSYLYIKSKHITEGTKKQMTLLLQVKQI